ncbi:tyrosine-type recombinase/integrase [Parvularcula maris]|uniref:Tyr recombinase domain-containing protein n=1 Tax=Parvularcula maris TaxID=2965077 RepID=A0A9X2LAB1_9PROT|nr:hypothetical protein [Parvularcula maris]MCQ8185952.1 hypothetical protein [Parvularcula maris]
MPIVTVSQAFDIYRREIVAADLRGKSPRQRQIWKNTKLRSVQYFTEVVGDVPILEITREDARRFRIHWLECMQDEKSPISANTANRHMGDLRGLFDRYKTYVGREELSNPFRALSFKDKIKKSAPRIETEWVRNVILKPGALSGLRDEIRLVTFIMIETGCRPGEVVNLLPEDIELDAKVPFIRIRPTLEGKNKREIKAEASTRGIPLVGIALAAMKQAPEGFPHYRDRSSSFSAAANKSLRNRGLFPTPDHVIYSFRHSFEKRMQEAGIDYGLRCLLMGHKTDRPKYGDGGSMAYRRDELMKIAHPFDDSCVE